MSFCLWKILHDSMLGDRITLNILIEIMSKGNILLVDCSDKKGLIHKISGVLLDHNCNITMNREFVDESKQHFYMRTEFEGEIKSKSIITDLQKVLPGDAKTTIPSHRKKKVVILVTKEHHCLAELLIRNEHNEINFEVSAVIGNHIDCQKLVEKFEIPFIHISHKGLQRSEHEQKIIQAIKNFNPDYLVLAKYMRVLTKFFVEKYHEKIINIHHSFLPAFVGANPYRQAYNRGVKIIGATAHFVTEQLDKGPIITQDVKHINHTFKVEAMKKASHDIEKIILVRALQNVCDDKVFINGNKTVVFD